MARCRRKALSTGTPGARSKRAVVAGGDTLFRMGLAMLK